MPGVPFTKDDPRINREGRPLGQKNFTTKVREALLKIAEGKDYTYEEAFIKSILKKAIVDGDVNMQKHIWNHLDGMPVQKQELGGLNGEAIKIEVAGEIADKNKLHETPPDTGHSS